eukprot:12897663-Prorocentrum_lima.AAC.1
MSHLALARGVYASGVGGPLEDMGHTGLGARQTQAPHAAADEPYRYKTRSRTGAPSPATTLSHHA